MAHPSRPVRHFASDNHAGIAPEALRALVDANHHHAPGYGEDAWTERACEVVHEIFETSCQVFFVFNGTAANTLALAALCRSYHAVVVHRRAHTESHECGGPEFFTGGAKLIPVDGPQGKLTPEDIEEAVRRRRGDMHFPKVRAVSFAQATEHGTVYTVDEVRALAGTARRHGLAVHMDGARFANAIAALGSKPGDVTWRSGVDVLSFGMTKNGLAAGEAVVFFNAELAAEFEYRLKQGGQLASKMRFLAAPFAAMLKDGAWLRHASHANGMARRLGSALAAIPGVRISQPVEANFVYPVLPQPAIDRLREAGWQFYDGYEAGECRLVCSWDTQPEDVDRFVSEVRVQLAV
jgi:threonine aldolase